MVAKKNGAVFGSDIYAWCWVLRQSLDHATSWKEKANSKQKNQLEALRGLVNFILFIRFPNESNIFKYN